LNDVGERELLAIIFTDAVDSTARTASDEDYSLRILLADLDYMRNEAAVRGGTVLKNTGDGLLISFKSAVDAVECALSIQRGFADRAENAAFKHKIGVHIGDVIKKDGDIYGSGVNTASRLVAQCPAGGICVSSTLYELVKQKSQIGNLHLEDFQLTNIEPPIKAYRIQAFGDTRGAFEGGIPTLVAAKKKTRRKPPVWWLALAIGVLALISASTFPAFWKKTGPRKFDGSLYYGLENDNSFVYACFLKRGPDEKEIEVTWTLPYDDQNYRGIDKFYLTQNSEGKIQMQRGSPARWIYEAEIDPQGNLINGKRYVVKYGKKSEIDAVWSMLKAQ